MTSPRLIDPSEAVTEVTGMFSVTEDAREDIGRIQTTDSPSVEPAAHKPYTSSWEHICDELACLDLRIKQHVVAQWGRQPASPLDQFKGLVVSDSEVATLLNSLRSSTN